MKIDAEIVRRIGKNSRGSVELMKMDPSPERDKLALELGYSFSESNYSDAIPKKFKDEANNSKIIKGDPLNKNKSELEIEKEILYFLFKNRIEHWSMKVKGEIHMKSSTQGFIKPTKNPGFPDILCCYKGLFVTIEVKKPSGIQSVDQISQENRIKSANGFYFICTSVREVEACLKSI